MTPRALREIRNIEVSSRCNLACRYCIHPTMPRPKVDIADDVWAAALDHVRYYVARGTQGELNLNLTGESTLHPRFAELCLEARAVLGPQRELQFTTNGKGITDALVKALVPAWPRVCVTAHHAHLAGPAAALFRKYGLLRSVSNDPVTSAQTWAGQVDWFDSPRAVRQVCPMLAFGYGTIQADGMFVVCCMDGANETAFGTVFDPPGSLGAPMRPWRLCPSCWQRPPGD